MGKRKHGSKSIGRQRKKGRVKPKAKSAESTSDQIQIEHAYVFHDTPAASNSLSDIDNDEVHSHQQDDVPHEHVDQNEQLANADDIQNVEQHLDKYESHVLESVDEIQDFEQQDNVQHAHAADQSPESEDEIFQKLKCDIGELRQQFVEQNFSILNCTKKLHALQFYELDETQTVAIKYCVTIDVSLTPSIHVHGKLLPSNHPVYHNVSKLQTADEFLQFISSLSKFCVCYGNPEPELVCNFTPVSSTKAYLETNVGGQYNPTVRSISCPLLIESPGRRCTSCMSYRSTLRKSKNAKITESVSPVNIHSSKPNCAMAREELEEKTRLLKLENKKLNSEKKRLRARLLLQEEIKTSHSLKEEDNEEVETLVSEVSPEIEKIWPDPHSFQRIFWEEQMKYNQLENKSAMRWHPLIVKWALLIKSQSSKAYQSMRDLGFVNLPSERTLYDYSHCVPSKMGFIPEVAKMLIKECKEKGLYNEEHTKYVGLLQDEIKIKDDLVYCPTTGQLIGFVDLDQTSNQIQQLESGVLNTERKLASSVLVIMVRGATSNLKFPFAAFATNGLDADQLQAILMKSVSILEIDCGLKCLFITCDGAGQNRKFFDLNKTDDSDAPCHCMPNPFAIDGDRMLYFISDVPHLLKTARNCFSNSGSHTKSRNLWKDGKNILWTQIVNLFKKEIELNLYVKNTKLSRAHVDLNAFNKMKVNLAAETLSNSVAELLEKKYGDEVAETVKFIRHMNRFFDCLNTRHLYEGTNKIQGDKEPYIDMNDPRFEYLQSDFLGYFDAWKSSVASRPGKFTAKELAGMQISQQTIDGFKISIRSIVACVRLLLSEGAPFVLTNVFNQDILEQHFGHHRHKGGLCDAPTVNNVRHTITVLRVVGSTAVAPLRGNTKRVNCTPEFIDSSLQRKKSRSGLN